MYCIYAFSFFCSSRIAFFCYLQKLDKSENIEYNIPKLRFIKFVYKKLTFSEYTLIINSIKRRVIELKEEYYFWLLNAIKESNAYYESSSCDSRLNRTETMLLNVVRFKTAAGEKVISTQIADYLNVTRSAVSQTVNKLEQEGYIRRESSDSDRKIFYVCLSERERLKLEEELEKDRAFFEQVATKMGKNEMNELRTLGNKFFKLMRETREGGKAKENKKRNW